MRKLGWGGLPKIGEVFIMERCGRSFICAGFVKKEGEGCCDKCHFNCRIGCVDAPECGDRYFILGPNEDDWEDHEPEEEDDEDF